MDSDNLFFDNLKYFIIKYVGSIKSLKKNVKI